MYCDLAIQNVTTNIIEAYGQCPDHSGRHNYRSGRHHVLLRQRPSGQSAWSRRYARPQNDADHRPARLRHAVGHCSLPYPGRIVDKENVLTSREGYYDTRTKLFTFRQNVRLVNPKGTLTADSLLYNSLTRIATFQGPTRITNKDGVLTAIDGQYNTTTGISNFQRRATVETPKYRLTGDSFIMTT